MLRLTEKEAQERLDKYVDNSILKEKPKLSGIRPVGVDLGFPRSSNHWRRPRINLKRKYGRK